MIGARLLGSIAFQLQRFGYITCCAGERKRYASRAPAFAQELQLCTTAKHLINAVHDRIKQQARAQYAAPSAGLLANDGQTTIGGEAFA